jgi:hypothetical protein
MPRYYGVKCGGCGKNIPLEIRRPTLEGKAVNVYCVPLDPILCPDCGHRQQYGSEHARDFDGPDGLLEASPHQE